MYGNTNFHFQIAVNSKNEDGDSRKKIYEALDRFSQLFIAPMFKKSAMEDQMKAVNSEHEKHVQSDVARLSQLHQSTVNSKHPSHKYGNGCMETLDERILVSHCTFQSILQA